jgi:hypothetical protein
MATAYRRGSEFELRVKREFEEAGYWVMRSSLSRGVADLLAIDLADPLTKIMIQCKRTKERGVAPAQWNQLYKVAMSTLSVPVIAAAVFHGGSGPTAGHVVGRTLHRVMGPKRIGSRSTPWVPWELKQIDQRTMRGSLPVLAHTLKDGDGS